MTQNPMPQIDDVRLYEKCALCHLFITDNDAYGGDNYDRDDIAEFDHLSRGDEADEDITSTHDATPSGMLATLAVWEKFGPPEMIARFDKEVEITWSVTQTYGVKVKTQASMLTLDDKNGRLAEFLNEHEIDANMGELDVKIISIIPTP